MKYCNYFNSVLTLQVSTASLPHDHEPCEIKVVSNHTCSLHTCVCARSRKVCVRLNGFRRQGTNSWGFSQIPYSGLGLCRTTPNDSQWERRSMNWFIYLIRVPFCSFYGPGNNGIRLRLWTQNTQFNALTENTLVWNTKSKRGGGWGREIRDGNHKE